MKNLEGDFSFQITRRNTQRFVKQPKRKTTQETQENNNIVEEKEAKEKKL